MNDDRAVGQHAGVGGFVARHHARLALDPFDRAVAALLGVEGKADADGAAVGLGLRLAGADGGQIDHVARGVERRDIVAGVEPHAGGGLIGQLGGGDDVLPPQIERLAAELARDLVDQPLDRKAGARPRHAAIGAHRRLVGGDRVGFQVQMPDAIGAGQIARRHAGFHEGAGRPERIGAGVDIDRRPRRRAACRPGRPKWSDRRNGRARAPRRADARAGPRSSAPDGRPSWRSRRRRCLPA